MAPSPIENVEGPVGITIKASGQLIADGIEILSVRVTHQLNQIPKAVIELMDGSIAENEFPLTDAADFVAGTDIEIAAFYGSGTEQILFKGIITAARFRIRGGDSQLILTCRDKAVCLSSLRRTASYVLAKDSEVIERLLSDAGLSADVQATTDGPANIVQYDSSDWDFLCLLADRNGQVVTVADGRVTTATPDPSTAAAMTLTLGMDIIDLNVNQDAASLYASAQISGWDPSSQAVISKGAAVSEGGHWGNTSLADLTGVTGNRQHTTTTPYANGPVDLDEVVSARALRPALAAMRGTCRYQGSSLAGPGDVIELTGVGDRMGGNAFVSGIIHIIAAGNWTTTARLGLPAAWHSDSRRCSSSPAGGLATPVHGLHVATVLDIVSDGSSNPMADDTMIHVSVPLFGDTPAQLWARYSQPYATNKAGMQFLPEIGDEVIVGFLSADPGAPVILGCMHSAKHSRSNQPGSENEIKSITTRSGIAITFDDENQILSAATPHKQSIVLDDDSSTVTLTDETGNTLTMSKDGIEIVSNGSLNLKAVGDVNVSGRNISTSAQTTLSLEGRAAANLESSGQTTVKRIHSQNQLIG